MRKAHGTVNFAESSSRNTCPSWKDTRISPDGARRSSCPLPEHPAVSARPHPAGSWRDGGVSCPGAVTRSSQSGAPPCRWAENSRRAGVFGPSAGRWGGGPTIGGRMSGKLERIDCNFPRSGYWPPEGPWEGSRHGLLLGKEQHHGVRICAGGAAACARGTGRVESRGVDARRSGAARAGGVRAHHLHPQHVQRRAGEQSRGAGGVSGWRSPMAASPSSSPGCGSSAPATPSAPSPSAPTGPSGSRSGRW